MRTRLDVDTLHGLLEISIEGPSLKHLDVKSAIDMWWKDSCLFDFFFFFFVIVPQNILPLLNLFLCLFGSCQVIIFVSWIANNIIFFFTNIRGANK